SSTLINLGCRTNAAETDEVAGLLADARNYVLINSCTVTTAADRDTRKAVARARREHPDAALMLMGCYVDAHPADTLGADVVIPNAWKQAPVGIETVEPPGTRRSRYVLKVQDGCDNRCTFRCRAAPMRCSPACAAATTSPGSSRRWPPPAPCARTWRSRAT